MSENEKNKKCFIVMAAVIVCFAFSPPQAGADTSLEKAKLLASDGAASDYFGRSVSISGDYAIVGAGYDDDKGTDSGSAYIFRWDGTSWSQQQKLTASDGADSDFFGYSVSISGDYAIVGAYGDADNGSSSGSAYIFRWDGTSWSQQQKLLASDSNAGDRFGFSVSISDDYAIVGAAYDSDKGTRSGSVYIFKQDGASWSQQQKITASDGSALDIFGGSVSISGDYAIVGAFFDDDKGTDSGSAYIFKLSDTSWDQQAKLTASDGAASQIFGCSVSISGDYAIIGAYGYDGNGSSSGSAYIFRRDGTSWSQQQKLIASDGAASDYLGRTVSIGGNYAIVGAYGDDDKGTDSGSAYIFERVCPAADLSGDCFVNFVDFAIFSNQWLQSPGVPSADIAPLPNGDGIVNFLDLEIFADWWIDGTD